jgi:RNA-directed DNA polymerase
MNIDALGAKSLKVWRMVDFFHYDQIAEICKKFQDSTQGTLINKLNPIILGWSNYFSSAVSSKAFKKLDYLVWRRIWRWCKRRHPKKSSKWVKEKYFRKIGNRNWVFSDGENTLRLHSDTKIIRHTRIKSDKSPYDGDFPYWARRMSNYPQASMRVSKLLKKQKGICNQCGLYFMTNQIAEVDHIIPVVIGGRDTYANLQLLHKHCHDLKSQNDGSHSRKKGIELLSSPTGN